MTSATIVLAPPPAALGSAPGPRRTSRSVAVIGGMITSTLLTLVVVPAAYSLVESRDLLGLSAGSCRNASSRGRSRRRARKPAVSG